MNNTQVDNAKDLNVVMPMYNLIEYRGNYSKTFGNLWQYYRDESHNTLANSELFNPNTKNVEIGSPLKYLVIFGELLKCY